mmetsp:Transcript_24522/g.51811  ORF Transcript_24522/g.51811 Transcript_24522/m.51811 type:complete len:221 (+) Transcript_24522:2548-3210(+)
MLAKICPVCGVLVKPPVSTISFRVVALSSSSSIASASSTCCVPRNKLNMTETMAALITFPARWFPSSSLPSLLLLLLFLLLFLLLLLLLLNPTTIAVPPLLISRPGSSSKNGRASKPPQSAGASTACFKRDSKSPPYESTMRLRYVVPLRNQTMEMGCPLTALKRSTAVREDALFFGSGHLLLLLLLLVLFPTMFATTDVPKEHDIMPGSPMSEAAKAVG